MANVSTLHVPVVSQLQKSSVRATEKDAQSLALRLLDKRARVRLSPEPIDLSSVTGKPSLFAVANTKGLFAAVISNSGGEFGLVISSLAALRSTFEAATDVDDQPFEPQNVAHLSGSMPVSVTFAFHESRLLVGLLDGSILVYATDQLTSSGSGQLSLIHTFATSPAPILSVQPNPKEIPEVVAVLRDRSNSLTVELLDVQKLVSLGGWIAGDAPNAIPSAMSWSPHGKQLALGFQGGNIVTFSPTNTATSKFSVPCPPDVNETCIISMQWLSTTSFYAIFVAPGQLTLDTEQVHFHISFDSKTSSAQYTRFDNPYQPFPGLRPPGPFMVSLKGWDPYRTLVFVGDGTSSDIGLVGTVTSGNADSWHNLSLEETSVPSLPLDKDQNETIMLGLELDLTNAKSYRHTTASGEALDLPSPPIMYAYASDGTVLGWFLLNSVGTVYPPMIKEASASMDQLVPSSITREPSSDMHTTPSVSPTAPFGNQPFQATPATEPPSVPAFSQPTVSDIPAFSSSTSQTAPLFGKALSFGQPSFGQPAPSASPTFAHTTASGFGSAAPSSVGFGAFGSIPPAKFGQPTLGFGRGVVTQPVESGQASDSHEESMAEDAPSMGSLGLGSSNTSDADSKPSIFGNISGPVPSVFQSTGSTLIKPSTAFGSSTNLDQKSPFANPSPFVANPSTSTFGAFGSKPAQLPAFGQPGSSEGKPTFGQSTFGQSAFGQPAFGQSAFGQSSFGQSTFNQTQATGLGFGNSSFKTTPSTSIPATSSASGGAFSTFASGAPSTLSAFTNKSASAKPVWATAGNVDNMQDPEKPVFGAETTAAVSTPFTTPKTETTFTVKDPTKDTPFSLTSRESSMKESGSRSPSPVPVLIQSPSTAPAATLENKLNVGGASGDSAPASTFKPAQGFFSEMPKASPYFTLSPQPVSAFSSSEVPPASTTLAKPDAAPTFGSSSMPDGTPKGSHGTVTPSVATPTLPATSAFSSFASSGGFGSFAGSGTKSFGDILRSGGEASKDPTKEKASVFGVVSATLTGPSATSSTTPATTLGESTKEKTFVFGVSPINLTGSSTPSSVPPPSTPGKALFTAGKQDSTNKAPPSPSLTPAPESSQTKVSEVSSVQEGSYELMSSSTSSSFVDVSADEGEFAEETVAADGEADETQSFELPSDSEESGREVESDEETPIDAHQLSPVTPRSPSTTPKAEHPRIGLSISPSSSPPPQAPSSGGAPRTSPVRELSTTPPTSPVQDHATTPAPVSKPSPPVGSPFSLAPRVNAVNRPTRSSPLASAPVVANIEPSTTPRSLFGSVPPTPAVVSRASVSVDQGSEQTKNEETPPTPVSRPKTPLFSTTAVPGQGGTSTFSSAAASASATPGPTLTPFTLPAGFPPLKSTPPTLPPFTLSPSLFSTPTTTPTISLGSPSVTPSPSIIPLAPTQPKVEEGMQTECADLVTTLTQELESLRGIASTASRRAGELKKVSGVTHIKADLAAPNKWVFGDHKEYGRILSTVQEDIKELKRQHASLRKTLRDTDSNLLKAFTRKEEIVRFDNARTDTELAKMLKQRTLGPEYLEIRSQLRRKVAAVRDRVQKLEDHLQSSKKRLQEFKTGKPKFRPPSLDTVNRTLRNIDIAIEQQQRSVDELQSRMSRLNISGGTMVLRDRRLIGSTTKRPLNITPDVAVTTAAALNAERSAQKLKRALLAARSSPLLNTKVASSSAAISFQTPRKTILAKTEDESPTSPFKLPSTLTSFPTWSPPSLDVSSSPPAGMSTTRHRTSSKHHQRPTPLKKNFSSGTEPSAKPPSFDWGPLPPSTKPITPLAFDLRQPGSSS